MAHIDQQRWNSILNETKIKHPIDKSVQELFELQVEQTPESIAIVFGNEKWTYRQLNDQANKLAHYLHKLGVNSDTLVGLFLHRSVQMVIGLLGVLKAGGAYVPYDPTYPQERLDTMFREVSVKILLTQESLTNQLPIHKTRVVFLDKNWSEFSGEDTRNLTGQLGTPENLAYVVFTSGSTGKPKATAVSHIGWSNLLNWFSQEFQIGLRDKVLVVSSFSFDITQRSLLMPLVNGAELHLLASNYFEPDLILNTIEASQITLLNCAPSPFYTLTESQSHQKLNQLRSLKKVFLGGEPISASRLQNCLSCESFTAEFVNVYGVAECSDVSTFYRLHDFERYAVSSVPLGKPIFNTKVYVVDEQFNLVPNGQIGELCIGGDGVGMGYLNDQVLTSEKFIPDPFNPQLKAKLYKTGDLVRYLSDRNLEFIGRLDHQVKIRGMRIELGEIETSLRQHTSVQEAVVLVKETSSEDKRLVAFILPSVSQGCGDEQTNKTIEEKLRQHLNNKIPQYMIPNKFVFLKKMPLNPNGKLDRNALQNILIFAEESNSEKPKTAIEIAIAAFFAEALNADKVSFNEDFFDMGGHSLLATQVLLRIKEAFGVDLDSSVFSSPKGTSVASLAEIVMEARRQLE